MRGSGGRERVRRGRERVGGDMRGSRGMRGSEGA